MAEVVRDVKVRITLEQVEAALKVPSIAPAKAAIKEVETITTDVSESVGQSVREAILAISNEAKAAAKEEAAVRAAAQAAADVQKQSAREARAAEQAAEKAAAAYLKTQKAALETADKFKTAGEGAFTFARGVAFLTTSSDESFAAVLKRLAQFQGAFDVFKGGTDVVKNTYEAMQALKVATGAATIAQAALSAATAAQTVIVGYATAAWAALQTVMGPIGWAIAAAGAIAVGVSLLAMGGDAEAATDSLSQTSTGMAGMKTQARTTADEIDRLGEALANALSAEREIASFQAQFQSFDQQLSALAARQEQRAVKAGQTARSVILELNKVLFPDENNKAFDDLVRNLDPAAAAAELDRVMKDLPKLSESLSLDEGQVEKVRSAYEFVASTAQAAKQEEMDRLAILDAQTSAMQAQADAMRKQVDEAKRAVELEQDRLRTLDEIAGRLNPEQRRELKALSDKAKSGEKLSDEELRRVESLGGAGVRDFVANEFAERGRGLSDVFEPFQVKNERRNEQGELVQDFGQNLRGKGSKVEGLIGNRQEATDELEPVIEALAEAIEENNRQRKERVDRIIELIAQQTASQEDLQELENRLRDGATKAQGF